ncbi:tetratricopeptide repeat protein [uncultured Caballeronia sp.]|jgi:Tetratricopeptide repeat|uniref:tetratricopeptide repeat protein n=1 Tax=uncultured Caballeronia sp. TaxID=1827198 RepID=UPI0015753BFB
MKKYVVAMAASLMLVSAAAFAVPSAGQIEQSMTQGNWAQADSQLNEVIQAHPNNAKAHYLYAQVLDREGRPADALAQIQQAKTLDPAIKFTDPSRFNAMEARIRSDANRVNSSSNLGGQTNERSTGNAVTSVTRNPFNQGAVAAPEKHGPSMGMWVLLAVVVAGIALVLRWGLKRARSNEDGQADTDRRTQLKRATELLNDVRSLKLDVRLSTQPGHESMLKEVEGIETQLRQMVEALSNSKNPVPPYAIEDLASQIDSVRARSEGRPDPRAAAPAANVNDNQSVYAQEAERFGRTPPGQPPYSPYPQQQPPVVIQQGGGGFGGGLGGLLGGVLLGEALSGGGRERVIERDVPVDVDDELRRRGGGNNGGGLDFGNGSNDWSDGGGGVDLGSNDSGNWDNNS